MKPSTRSCVILRTQYLLGYYPPELPETNEPFRPIEVRVNRRT